MAPLVNVVAPVIVAALGNGNDIVGVCDAVSDQETGRREPSILKHAPLPETRCSSALDRIPRLDASGAAKAGQRRPNATIARGSAMQCASHFADADET